MVESGNKNKGLLIGVAAGCALVGAALLYHFFSEESGEGSASGSQLEEELIKANLLEVKKQGNMLDP